MDSFVLSSNTQFNDNNRSKQISVAFLYFVSEKSGIVFIQNMLDLCDGYTLRHSRLVLAFAFESYLLSVLPKFPISVHWIGNISN